MADKADILNTETEAVCKRDGGGKEYWLHLQLDAVNEQMQKLN